MLKEKFGSIINAANQKQHEDAALLRENQLLSIVKEFMETAVLTSFIQSRKKDEWTTLSDLTNFQIAGQPILSGGSIEAKERKIRTTIESVNPKLKRHGWEIVMGVGEEGEGQDFVEYFKLMTKKERQEISQNNQTEPKLIIEVEDPKEPKKASPEVIGKPKSEKTEKIIPKKNKPTIKGSFVPTPTTPSIKRPDAFSLPKSERFSAFIKSLESDQTEKDSATQENDKTLETTRKELVFAADAVLSNLHVMEKITVKKDLRDFLNPLLTDKEYFEEKKRLQLENLFLESLSNRLEDLWRKHPNQSVLGPEKRSLEICQELEKKGYDIKKIVTVICEHFNLEMPARYMPKSIIYVPLNSFDFNLLPKYNLVQIWPSNPKPKER